MTRNQEVHDDDGASCTAASTCGSPTTCSTAWRASTCCERCTSIAARSASTIEFERRVDDVDEFADCDLIVAADGANSAIRTRYAAALRADARRAAEPASRGTARPRLFDPLSLIFRQNADGLLIAHTYRYSRTHSTFLVECDPATFDAARPRPHDRRRKASPIASRSSPTTCRATRCCRTSRAGSATRSSRTATGTGATSCCSATRCAPGTRRSARARGSRCRIRSRCSRRSRRVRRRRAGAARRVRAPAPARLGRVAGRRRSRAPSGTRTWARSCTLDPVSFAYDYLVRNGRVAHAEVRERDPELAAAYEKLHPEVA